MFGGHSGVPSTVPPAPLQFAQRPLGASTQWQTIAIAKKLTTIRACPAACSARSRGFVVTIKLGTHAAVQATTVAAFRSRSRFRVTSRACGRM